MAMPATQPPELRTDRAANELPAVRELASSMLGSADQLAESMAKWLHAEIPELVEHRGGPLFEETRASCHANVEQILRSLCDGDRLQSLQAPPQAIEYARSYVRRELALAVLLRAYRLGQAYFLNRFTVAMSTRMAARPELVEAILAVNAWVVAYVDKVSDELVVEYQIARGRWARTPDAIRAETVRAILGGTLRDEFEAGRLLGHDLGRGQHIAVVLWQAQPEGASSARALPRALSAVAAALRSTAPLVVPSGGSELWAWYSAVGEPERDWREALAGIELPPDVRLAAGRPAPGIEGFRSSHDQALAAARVAVLAGDRAPAGTQYDDVALVSLLSADLERARDFVTRELGALAGSDLALARLRETVLVLLEEGMSNSRAGQRLHVHHNTVVYRAARAKELLGRPLTDRRTELTAALMLAQTLGEAVLDAELTRSITGPAARRATYAGAGR